MPSTSFFVSPKNKKFYFHLVFFLARHDVRLKNFMSQDHIYAFQKLGMNYLHMGNCIWQSWWHHWSWPAFDLTCSNQGHINNRDWLSMAPSKCGKFESEKWGRKCQYCPVYILIKCSKFFPPLKIWESELLFSWFFLTRSIFVVERCRRHHFLFRQKIKKKFFFQSEIFLGAVHDVRLKKSMSQVLNYAF